MDLVTAICSVSLDYPQGLHLCLCKLSGDSRTLLEVPQNAWQAPEDVALGNKASSSFSLTRKNKIAAEDCL